MMRALLFGTVSLVAVECLAMADAPTAYAGPGPACSAVGPLPNGGVPIGDFTIAQGTLGNTGALDGTSSSLAYPECVTGSLNAIPFDAAGAGTQKITVAQAFTTLGGYFDLILDAGTANSQTFVQPVGSSQATVPFGVTATVTAGLNTLEISETNNNPVFAQDHGDLVSVTITNNNFIPEPATMGLLGFGSICLAGLRRLRRRG